MEKGIYITANDKVADQAIALLNSIRAYDADIPVVLIPYNDDYHSVASRLGQDFGVTVFEDLDLIERLSSNLHSIFGKGFFARANQFRKQVCWFGPFEKFLYIDTDIVVFSQIAKVLDYLNTYDFVCYDYQHTGGITNVFTPEVFTSGVFAEADRHSLFNCGFWASKRRLFSEADLYDVFRECANHPEYFDFSQKTSDQPIINYMILKHVTRRFNVVHREGKAPGSWAGSRHFEQRGHRLIDPKIDQPLDYLHWAGIRIQPGCPYWEIWAYYRYLNNSDPRPVPGPPPAPPSPWQQLSTSLKRSIKNLLNA